MIPSDFEMLPELPLTPTGIELGRATAHNASGNPTSGRRKRSRRWPHMGGGIELGDMAVDEDFLRLGRRSSASIGCGGAAAGSISKSDGSCGLA